MYGLVWLVSMVAAAAAQYITGTPAPRVCKGTVAPAAPAVECTQVSVPSGCAWACTSAYPVLVPCNYVVGCNLYNVDPKTAGVMRCKRRLVGTRMPCTVEHCCRVPVAVVPGRGRGARQAVLQEVEAEVVVAAATAVQSAVWA